MSEIEILKQFKNSLISFLDELIVQFPEEGDIVIFRIFVKDRIIISNIVNYFVQKILPLKKMVDERNEDFFLNHCSIFEDINNDTQNHKVNKFKKLWRSNCLVEDVRIVIWKWFDSFMFLSEKYQKILLKTNTK